MFNIFKHKKAFKYEGIDVIYIWNNGVWEPKMKVKCTKADIEYCTNKVTILETEYGIVKIEWLRSN